jgi:hypothetical protein
MDAVTRTATLFVRHDSKDCRCSPLECEANAFQAGNVRFRLRHRSGLPPLNSSNGSYRHSLAAPRSRSSGNDFPGFREYDVETPPAKSRYRTSLTVSALSNTLLGTLLHSLKRVFSSASYRVFPIGPDKYGSFVI